MTKVDRKTVQQELGISQQRLSALIKQGKITEGPDGIDLDRARAEYAANTDPAKRAAYDDRTGRQPAEQGRGLSAIEGNGQGLDYNTVRTHQAAYKAKMEELRYKQAVGKLIDRDEVKAREFAVARKLRDRLQAFPSRLAPMIPKETRTPGPLLHQLVIDEFHTLIRELQEDAASIAG